MAAMDVATLGTTIGAYVLPPLGMYWKYGASTEFGVSIPLTLLGWVPGVVYAAAQLQCEALDLSHVGMGLTSREFPDLTYQSVIAAIQKTIREPWLLHPIKQDDVSGKDCVNYYQRTMKLPHSNEVVREHIKINEEEGTFCFLKMGLDNDESTEERVTRVHREPVRIEMYTQDSVTGKRLNWSVPQRAVRLTFLTIAQIAHKLNNVEGIAVGFGMTSKVFNCTEDQLWEAMLLTIREPEKCGMNVNQVEIEDNGDHLVRTMNVPQTNKSKVDKVRIYGSNKEIVIRSVKDGVEEDTEQVFFLCSHPPRVSIHARKANDEMYINWSLPRNLATHLFSCVQTAVSFVCPMNIETFKGIYNSAVMNSDGTLHWDHFCDALKAWKPEITEEAIQSKRPFFDQMAGTDGHLTWAKAEHWFDNHRWSIDMFKNVYDGAVMNDDGTLHWDHFCDAVKKWKPEITNSDLAGKKPFFDEVAGDDGHLTWAKVERWFANHRV